jgi:hypothetical protein
VREVYVVVARDCESRPRWHERQVILGLLETCWEITNLTVERRAANPKVETLEFLGRLGEVSRADRPWVLDIEQAAAMAAHGRDYGDRLFRRV